MTAQYSVLVLGFMHISQKGKFTRVLPGTLGQTNELRDSGRTRLIITANKSHTTTMHLENEPFPCYHAAIIQNGE
ncbi:hypothetical protein XELAEV_18047371mg [Xenopus laevis]|uniref:Uncharacterized protein n=1 Tax=Xenopus laevis TaxID=8355 RepID=A0A974BUU2_XENLA|nr:hypothetical protein XELAEV_18047371mg [Xenopus laevis]